MCVPCQFEQNVLCSISKVNNNSLKRLKLLQNAWTVSTLFPFLTSYREKFEMGAEHEGFNKYRCEASIQEALRVYC